MSPFERKVLTDIVETLQNIDNVVDRKHTLNALLNKYHVSMRKIDKYKLVHPIALTNVVHYIY